MAPDGAALARAGCGSGEAAANQLCRAQLDRFRAAVETGRAVTVTCTQEAPLFREVAEDMGAQQPLAFANIRETAGWTHEARSSAPKMAAIIAAAAEAPAAFNIISMESRRGADAGPRRGGAEAARQMSESLDITVLLLPGADVAPRAQTTFPVLQGRVAQAQGHLGTLN
jgi:hypothetical protein